MTHKEIAERLRDIADGGVMAAEPREAMWSIADTLDPPRPESGTMRRQPERQAGGGTMTHKEIADELRDALDPRRPPYIVEQLRALIAKLDPPLPEPGTVWWFRGVFFGASKTWQLGEAEREGIYPFASEVAFAWRDIEWKPARILEPDEVAVKVPPVSEWPDNAGQILAMYATVTSGRISALTQIRTRAEAERMEAER